MKKAEDVLRKWLKAVNLGNVELLIALYDKQAVLIPTFSNKILATAHDIREYFINLAKRERLSVQLHKKTLKVQKAAEGINVLCGIYCWRFSIDDELFSFEARFSFVLNMNLKNPIIQHHSSQIPRML